MFKKITVVLLIAIVAVFSFIGCGEDKQQEEKKESTSTQYPDAKVGMVTDSGTITDKSFNQGTWEGIKMAEEEFGIKTKYLQPGGETKNDYLTEIGNLVDAGYQLIVTPGFKFEETIYDAQTKYPDTKFILIDGAPHDKDFNFKTEPNVISVFFAENESGFLGGVAAALESKNGKLGFIGGMEIPPVQKFGWGYVAGAAYANKHFGTNVSVADYIYQGTFYEVEAGQQIAASMYDKGIDVIHCAAGGVGVGAINEAKTRKAAGENVFIVGVDKDQYDDGKLDDGSSIILTSAVKNVSIGTYDYIKAFLEGKFEGGNSVYLTAKEDGVGLPAENPNLSDDTKAKVAEVLKGLKDGSIKAPATVEELNAFLEEQGYTTPDGVNY